MSLTRAWLPLSLQDDVRVTSIVESLENTSEQFFATRRELFEIEVAEVGSQGTKGFCLKSEAQLQEHTSVYHDRLTPSADDHDDAYTDYKISFFFLEPEYGLSHLPITKNGAMNLLSALQPFPELYRYITAFGRKRFSRDEGFASFDSNVTIGEDGSWTSFDPESSYLLKYVDRRDVVRPGANPWSIRHALIYQKAARNRDEVSHLLIRLPVAVKQLLGTSLFKRGNERSLFTQDWTHLHVACFGSVDDNLRQFINYLDEEVTKLFKRVIMAGVEPDKLNEFDTLQNTASDFKSLQYFSDQIKRVINIIELNILTLKSFQKKIRYLETLMPRASEQPKSCRTFLRKLSQFQTEHEFSLNNASSVLERVRATLEQLRDTVFLRNGEFNKMGTEMTSRNTSAIVHLADRSGRETHVVKTLTVLALVFVPASFVADFLQMDFITIKQEEPMQWSAKADLKIYAILAIPLITVTMLIYALVEMVQRAKESNQEEDVCKIV